MAAAVSVVPTATCTHHTQVPGRIPAKCIHSHDASHASIDITACPHPPDGVGQGQACQARNGVGHQWHDCVLEGEPSKDAAGGG
jgi:hypothetical protein